MTQKISPAIFLFQPKFFNKMYIRTNSKNIAGVIREAGRLFKQYNPNYPFSYTFLDDDFNNLYQWETRQEGLFFYFAGVAIIISCLGLFALATYTAQTRFREIGIRKVLGASVPDIVGLLGKNFIRLVLIAIGIAIPIAWYAMNQWLQGFAYRTDIGWLVFVASALITVAIAFLTISFQAVKAAVANPVKSLHAE
jgi:putative ABC transport system permease protein